MMGPETAYRLVQVLHGRGHGVWSISECLEVEVCQQASAGGLSKRQSELRREAAVAHAAQGTVPFLEKLSVMWTGSQTKHRLNST